MPLYNKLKEYRAKLGVNQQEMGVLVQTSRQTISQIESHTPHNKIVPADSDHPAALCQRTRGSARHSISEVHCCSPRSLQVVLQ